MERSDILMYFRIFISNKMHLVGLIILLFFLFDALILQFYPQLIGIKDPNSLSDDYNFNIGFIAPSSAYPFGTTYGGINLLVAILKSIRIDVFYILSAVILAAIIGVFLGIIAAYYGGIIDEITMRISDIFFSIPYIILIVTIGSIVSRNFTMISLSLSLAFFPLFAKYARSSTLELKNSYLILASKAVGNSNFKTILYHVLPNVITSSISQFSLTFSAMVGAFATLAFIGLVPNNNIPELGYITSFALQYIQVAPWAVIIPSIFIFLLALSLNLIGDGINDMLNPRNIGLWKKRNY